MIDWKQLFTDLNVPCWDSGKNVAPGNINIQCPFCDDHSNHLGFSIEKGNCQCWRCQGGSPVRAVSLAARIPQETARELIRKYSHGFSHTNVAKQTAVSNVKSITIPGSPIIEPHRKYLRGRGFVPEELEFYHGILGTTDVGYWQGIDFRYRIIIPVYDVWGNLCTFQGRDYTGLQELRYKCCPVEKAVTHHKHLLYGAELARNRRRIVVVEGVFDQWRLGPGAVATFGTSLTREQVNLLTMWEEVFFLFDPEPEAQEHARSYAKDIASCGRYVEVCAAEFGLDAKGNPRDPGDLTPDEARSVMKELDMI